MSEINLSYPQDEAKYLDNTLEFSWEAPQDSKEFLFQLSTDENFEEIVLAKKISNTWLMIENLRHYTLYYWRVSADGGEFSNPYKFGTDYNRKNALALVYDPNVNNMYIFDKQTWHGDTVANAFIKRYTELTQEPDVAGRVIKMGPHNMSYIDALDYAQEHNIPCVIKSTTGITLYSSQAEPYYPDFQLFMPLGSNTHKELLYFGDGEFPIAVTCGAGDAEQRNNTAYGNGLEFWDTDYHMEQVVGDRDASSYTNGVIAATLLYIKKQCNCSWWEARYRARISTEQIWSKENGFGKINVPAAIGYSGKIPRDPFIEYLPTPKEASLGGYRRGFMVEIVLGDVPEAEFIEIYKNEILIDTLNRSDLKIYDDGTFIYRDFVFNFRNIYKHRGGKRKNDGKILWSGFSKDKSISIAEKAKVVKA